MSWESQRRLSDADIFIIDASIAAKWFIDEEYSQEARKYLLLIQSNPNRFFVPELFYVEVLSVLSKCNLNADLLASKMSALQELGLSRLAHSTDIVSVAASFCCQYKLSAYDALYASIAKLYSGKWLTADFKAHSKIRKLEISKWIGD